MYASGLDIYRSSNGGSSYASITGSGTGLDLNNLPSSTADVLRIGIAVSPAAAGDLWAYVVCEDPSASTGKRIYVYRRTGSTWTMIRDWAPGGGTNNTSKGWTAIAVSPIDADKVYYGFTKVAGTENGGTSWQSKSPYSGNGFHADVHALAFPPNVSNPQLFCGHHGGVSQKDPSNTGTGGWTFLCDGLEVATIWAFDDSEFDSDRIIIGNQDCGTNVTNGSGGWQVIRGGDGYDGGYSAGYLADLWKWNGTNWVLANGGSTKDYSGQHSYPLGGKGVPGTRSGATISTSVLLGVDRSKAAKFSFLMVVPLILGKVAKDVLSGDINFQGDDIIALSAGFVAAFVAGLLACTWMISLVKKSKLSYFSLYCAIVGVIAIIYSLFF